MIVIGRARDSDKIYFDANNWFIKQVQDIIVEAKTFFVQHNQSNKMKEILKS